jgi:hypothetical protein
LESAAATSGPESQTITPHATVSGGQPFGTGQWHDQPFYCDRLPDIFRLRARCCFSSARRRTANPAHK